MFGLRKAKAKPTQAEAHSAFTKAIREAIATALDCNVPRQALANALTNYAGEVMGPVFEVRV